MIKSEISNKLAVFFQLYPNPVSIIILIYQIFSNGIQDIYGLFSTQIACDKIRMHMLILNQDINQLLLFPGTFFTFFLFQKFLIQCGIEISDNTKHDIGRPKFRFLHNFQINILMCMKLLVQNWPALFLYCPNKILPWRNVKNPIQCPSAHFDTHEQPVTDFHDDIQHRFSI